MTIMKYKFQRVFMNVFVYIVIVYVLGLHIYE